MLCNSDIKRATNKDLNLISLYNRYNRLKTTTTKMKKIVQKSLVFLRCRLGIKRHPVGFDSNGNSYYDNGIIDQ